MTIFDKITSLEQEAKDFGLEWGNTQQIMAQIESECSEIKEHLHAEALQEALQDEIGDLLHAAFSLCVFCKFSPQNILQKSLDKFENRLNAMKAIANEQGLTHLKGKPFDELMQYWDQAKARTCSGQK